MARVKSGMGERSPGGDAGRELLIFRCRWCSRNMVLGFTKKRIVICGKIFLLVFMYRF